MISDYLMIASACFIILLIGILPLLCIKDFIRKIDILLNLAISWLLGCFLIAFGSLVNLIASYYYDKGVFTLLIILYLLILLLFKKNITENIYQIKENLKNISRYPVKFSLEIVLNLILLLLFIIYLCYFLQLILIKPIWAWDAWMIWSFKAKLLYYNSFKSDFINNQNYAYCHFDYPLLVPLVHVFVLRFIGQFKDNLSLIFIYITYIVNIILLYSFIRKEFKDIEISNTTLKIKYCNTLIIILTIVMSILPVMVLNFLGAYTDGILSTYYMLAIMYVYRYIKSKSPNFIELIPVIIGVSGCIMTKNEGLLYCLNLLLVSIITCFFNQERLKRVFQLVISFIIGIFLNLPWLIFCKISHLSNDIISVNNLSSIQITNIIYKLPTAINYIIFNILTNLDIWGLLLYILPLIVLTAILQKQYLQIIFFIGTFTLNFILIIVVYLLSPHDITAHIASSADRVVMSTISLVNFFIISTVFTTKD